MKRPWLFVALLATVALGIVVHCPRRQRQFEVPPARGAAELAALPDYQLISQVAAELRWRLADLAPEDMPRWRSFPEPARHILVLAWLEGDEGPRVMSQFSGFADFNALTPPYPPTLDELAEAYKAIGAEGCAAAVATAVRVAHDAGLQPGVAPSDLGLFDKANRQLRSASAGERAADLLRKYIRAHLAEIGEIKPLH